MYKKLKFRFFLALALVCPGLNPVLSDIASVGHYSQTLIDSIVHIYPGNSSYNHRSPAAQANTRNYSEPENIVPTFIYPYLLLALWITCITSIICCCLYCKCQQAEQMTAYNSNGFELQEVHIMDHPLPHVKGCVCLGCLQRKVAQDLDQRTEQ